MNIGDIINKADYTAAAIWCNKHNAHIERKANGEYIIVENAPAEQIPQAPSLEERIAALEAENAELKAAAEAMNDTMLTVIEIIEMTAE